VIHAPSCLRAVILPCLSIITTSGTEGVMRVGSRSLNLIFFLILRVEAACGRDQIDFTISTRLCDMALISSIEAFSSSVIAAWDWVIAVISLI